MANYYPASDRGLYFDDGFNPGPYTLYGSFLSAKRHWDCEKQLSVSTKDIEGTGHHGPLHYGARKAGNRICLPAARPL